MKTPAAVAKEVTGYVFDRLEARGFIRSGLFLLRRRADGIHDWIALPHVVHVRNGPVLVTANVGLYVEPLHALLGLGVGATFCRNVGYLSPVQSWTDWPFERHAFSEGSARELFGSLVSYGLPFMESFTSHAAVIDGCLRYGLAHQNVARIPAMQILAGQRKEALSAIRSSLTAFRDKTDPYSKHQALTLTALLAYAESA